MTSATKQARAGAQDPDLANALAYLAKHPTRYLFPLVVENPKVRPKGKPAFYDNLALASNDPAQLRRWYAEHRHRGRVLWGLSLKKSGLVGIDVDCGPGKVGAASLRALIESNGPLPNTEVVRSPSYTPETPSRHIIYSGEHHFSTDKIGKNIDVPNYVLIPGIKFDDGRAYVLSRDLPMAPLPEFIAEKIKPRSTERSNNPPVDPIPLDVFKKMLKATPYTGGPDGLDDRHSYSGWLTFLMECHEAAGGDEGDYLDAVIQWSLDDPNQDWTSPTSPEYIERKWQSFTADPPPQMAARTRGSWLKLLVELDPKNVQFVGDANTAETDFADPIDDADLIDPIEHPSVTPEVKARWQEWADKKRAEKKQQKQDDRPFPMPLSLDQLLTGQWPQIEYTLEGLIMKGVVNTFNADGGTGKTTLSTQIGVAVATGKAIFGRKTMQAPVLLVLGEDGEGITQARVQSQITDLSVGDDFASDADKFPSKPSLTTWCLLGCDMTLAKITDDGRITTLAFYDKLDAKLTAMGPGAFVVLDSLIDIVQMDMIQPMAVNAFFKRLLTGLRQKHNATILVLAHPSKASMSDGSWVHGSLAMKNAVRNSIAMRKVEGQPYRVLWSLKHNYGGEDEMRLYFEKPLFTISAPSASNNPTVRRDALVLEAILDLMTKGETVVHNNQGAGHHPRAIADMLNEGGAFKPELKWRDVQNVMLAARRSGVLRYVAGYGKTPAHYERIEPTEGRPEDDFAE
jgi:hypothetical protein